MTRVFWVGTILGSAAAGLRAESAVPLVTESGNMLWIGLGLIAMASLTRHVVKTR